MSGFNQHKHNRHTGSGGKVLLGLIIIVFGVIFLFKQLGLLPYLNLRNHWPLILIFIGIAIGLKNRFTTPAPFILLAIGSFHLIPAFTFTFGGRYIDSEDLVVPLLLILGGLVMIFRPGKKKCRKETLPITVMSDRTISADVVFGGRKEIVTSKDFNGGSVSATFGGAEINLLQADTVGQTIMLVVRATFGGCEIIVPSHWDIKNEVETVLGSVVDKRTLRTPDASLSRKTLVLRGSCFCGSIEIKSY